MIKAGNSLILNSDPTSNSDYYLFVGNNNGTENSTNVHKYIYFTKNGDLGIKA
jgi:hypothetical protein